MKSTASRNLDLKYTGPPLGEGVVALETRLPLALKILRIEERESATPSVHNYRRIEEVSFKTNLLNINFNFYVNFTQQPLV